MKTKNPKTEIGKSNPLLKSLLTERTLLLDDHVLSEIDGDNEIISAGAYIKINEVLIDSLKGVSITREAMIDLYSKSDHLRTDALDVLALKIIFCVDGNHNLHYLYQPICLGLKEELYDARLQKQGIFDITDKGDIYKYAYPAASFTSTVIGTSATTYQHELKIVRRKKDGFETYSNGDVTSVIFSFQEIFALLHDNDSDLVKVYNAIRRTVDAQGFVSRHSLILAGKALGPLFPFENRYANLAHLCPPNCYRLMYPLQS